MPEHVQNAPGATGPLGGGDYIVRAGECVNSISYDHGLFWETIWNHANNSELKSKRKSPDLLLPGDKLYIPEKRRTPVDGATEALHRFRRKGMPIEFSIRVMKDRTKSRIVEVDPDKNTRPWAFDDGRVAAAEPPPPEPEANQKYRLFIGSTAVDGVTDGDGMLTQKILPSAQSGRLILRPGKPDERVIMLALGEMPPVTEPSGAAKRLNNLGYRCEIADTMTPGIVAALGAFQVAEGLEASGQLDGATQDKLVSVHGS